MVAIKQHFRLYHEVFFCGIEKVNVSFVALSQDWFGCCKLLELKSPCPKGKVRLQYILEGAHGKLLLEIALYRGIFPGSCLGRRCLRE